MRVQLIFRCGHEDAVDPDKTPSPRCWCGETQVARTRLVGPPRIVGCARGPIVETKALEPVAVALADRPLPLKGPDDAA